MENREIKELVLDAIADQERKADPRTRFHFLEAYIERILGSKAPGHRQISRALVELRKQGRIESDGSGFGTAYHLTPAERWRRGLARDPYGKSELFWQGYSKRSMIQVVFDAMLRLHQAGVTEPDADAISVETKTSNEHGIALPAYLVERVLRDVSVLYVVRHRSTYSLTEVVIWKYFGQ
ncbi:MAG TPA: hypothetical protein VLE72_00210 [Candidatus Saccharimonadales bacterium]|nr:hypothetical protein [Candidatus Saccharimonadales bacterium]